MKQMVRGAIAILALSGLSACVDDPLLPLNGDADRVQANPTVMNVRQGDSSAVLLRLINAANRATPTKFDITGVGAGIVVNIDPTFRPEFINGSDTLIVPEIKSVQRYFIRGVTPGEYNYTVTSNGISGTFKVRVEPINLGPALSRTTAVAGDDVTITAPPNTSFSPTSAVTFTTGSVAIKSRSADNKSIVVTVGPGITGPATVTLLKLDYFPALPGLTLASTNTLATPALTSIPLAYSSTNLAGDAPVTVTAAGFKFRSTSTITFNGYAAVTTGVSADSNTITIIPPDGITGVTGVANGVSLAFLPTIAINGLTSTAAITTAAATANQPALAGTGVRTAGTTPTLTVGPGEARALLDGTSAFTAADPVGGGGPAKYYRITVTGAAQDRTVRLKWTGAADLDFYLVNDGFTAFVGSTSASATSNNPEEQTITGLAAGSYWVVVINFGNAATPGRIRLDVK